MKRRPPGHDFDRIARWYDRGLGMILAPWGGEARLRRRIVAALAGRCPPGGARILETGCGTGANLAALDRLGRVHAVGLDLSLPMLREAARKTYAHPPLLVRGDAGRLPFPSGSFDAAMMVFALHEIPGEARRAALEEVLRVLKPGGCFLLADLARPAGGVGRCLGWLMGLFESREAMQGVRSGLEKAAAALPWRLESSAGIYLGLVRLSLFRKSGSSEKLRQGVGLTALRFLGLAGAVKSGGPPRLTGNPWAFL